MAVPLAGWRPVAVRLVSVAIKDRQGVSTVVDAYTPPANNWPSRRRD